MDEGLSASQLAFSSRPCRSMWTLALFSESGPVFRIHCPKRRTNRVPSIPESGSSACGPSGITPPLPVFWVRYQPANELLNFVNAPAPVGAFSLPILGGTPSLVFRPTQIDFHQSARRLWQCGLIWTEARPRRKRVGIHLCW